MPVMQINIIPLGTKVPSVSRYIKSALEVLKKEKNIKYEVTAMATVVETDSLDHLFALAKRMHQAVLNDEGVKRVVTTMNIDERRDKKSTIEEKIRSVDAG